MRRFYIEQGVSGDEVSIAGQEAHHIVNVLRMRLGDRLLICDNSGKEYECELVSVGESCLAKVLSCSETNSEPRLRITLYQGIPKGDKMEGILTRCTEIGVAAFVPVMSPRSVIRLTEKEAAAKRERYMRVVQAACKQCGRALIPEVAQPIRSEAIPVSRHELFIVCYEGELSRGLREAVENTSLTDIGLYIGPEGGLDVTEAERLCAAGALTVSLGRRILRTETAGCTAAALILGYNGEMG